MYDGSSTLRRLNSQATACKINRVRMDGFTPVTFNTFKKRRVDKTLYQPFGISGNHALRRQQSLQVFTVPLAEQTLDFSHIGNAVSKLR